jgi:SsrA-binding protein
MSRKKTTERFREVRNVRAHRDYFIDESLEVGIVLQGSEVKSIRHGAAQINDAFVRIDKGVPVLYHAHIPEYAFGTSSNHAPYRPRKLLLHAREIRKWEQAIQGGGRTIIPLRMYFKDALVKVEIALARGKRHYDKREDLKRDADLMEARRSLKQDG